MEAQYWKKKNNHVTYYVITQVGVYAAQQWYVITSDVTWDSRTAAGITDNVLEAGVQTSYVHSSIKVYFIFLIPIRRNIEGIWSNNTGYAKIEGGGII